MNKQSLLTASLLLMFIFGCKSKEEKLKDQITPILKASALQDSLVAVVDSLNVYNIDTLTTLQDSIAKQDRMLALINIEQIDARHNLTLAEMKNQSADLSRQQAALYSSMFGPGALVDAERDNVMRYLKDSKDFLDEAKKHTDKSQYYNKRIRNISKLREQRKLDSTSFKGYIVYYHLKGADKDNKAIRIDSLYNMINPELRVISFADINRK